MTGQRAGRKDARCDDISDHALSASRRGGQLYDDRHAGEQGGAAFSHKPQDGKLEGVDEQRHASRRRQQMLAGKGALCPVLRGAVCQHVMIAECCSPASVLPDSEDGAVDVDRRVVFRGP